MKERTLLINISNVSTPVNLVKRKLDFDLSCIILTFKIKELYTCYIEL